MTATPTRPQPPYTKNPEVERKLRDAIVPYIILSKRLWYRPLCLATTGYTWAQDLLAVLAGVGVYFPLAKLVSENEKVDLPAAIKGMPPALAFVTASSIIIWLVLKLIVGKLDGMKLTTLARNCRKEFKGYEQRCEEECQNDDPMVLLTKLGLDIHQTIQRNIVEESWPYAGLPIDAGFLDQVEEQLWQYCRRYGGRWKSPP